MIHEETTFNGIDQYNAPQRLDPGMLQQADNVLIEGGDLVTRPGMVGLLETAMAAVTEGGTSYQAIFAITPYRRIDNGDYYLIFVQGGKLWQWNTTTPTVAPVELKNGEVSGSGGTSFAFASGGKNVRLARYGMYLYGCDGALPLFRINLEAGTCARYAAMIAPSAPAVALSNTVIDTCTVATDWAGGSAPSSVANLLQNGSFENISGSTYNSGTGTLYPIADWTDASPSGQEADARDTSHDGDIAPEYGSFALLLDTPGDQTFQNTASGLPTFTYPPVDLPAQQVKVYNFQGYLHNADPTGKSDIVLTISAWDSSGDQLAAESFTLTEPYDTSTGTWTPVSRSVSFAGLTQAIDHLRVDLLADVNNTTGNASIYIDNVSLFAANTALVVTENTGASFPLLVSTQEGYTAQQPLLGGQALCRTFASVTDLSQSDIISVGINVPTTSLTAAGTNPQFQFGFMAATDTEVTWSNVCSYSTDSATLYCDCSTVLTATRQNCKYFFIQLLDDLTSAVNPADVFSFGPITGAGNLTLGDVYTYILDEIQTAVSSAADYDVVESPGSVLTASVTITDDQAQTQLTLSSYANNGADGRGTADTISLWRGGGVFTDGFWRLVGRCPVAAPSSSAAYSPGYTSGSYTDPQGVWQWNGTVYSGVLATGWTFNPATKVFTDNVPDSALLLADVYEENRDYWPTGAVDPADPSSADPRGAISCLCVSNGRLFGSAGNTVYASWLLSTDQEAGLYTSNQADIQDPSLTIKGMAFPLGSGQESDTVVALVRIRDAIAAFRQDVISTIEGTDPSNFATIDRFVMAGVGCVAPLSAIANANGSSVVYLSEQGLLEFDGGSLKTVGQEIELLLGVGDGTGIAAAGPFGSAVQVIHDRRRYLFCPAISSDPFLPGGASASVNSLAYVYDFRIDPPGYVRWTNVPAASATTAGGVLYIGGLDGMIYSLSAGFEDQATSGASGNPIAMAVTTRALGGELHHPYGWGGYTVYPEGGTIPTNRGAQSGSMMAENAGENPTHEKRPSRYYFELSTPAENVPVTLSLFGDSNPTNVWSGTWTTRADGGETNDKMRVDSSCRGVHMTLGLSASVTQKLRIRRLAIESQVGKRR